MIVLKEMENTNKIILCQVIESLSSLESSEIAKLKKTWILDDFGYFVFIPKNVQSSI